MHDPLITPEQIDDFVILRARRFTSSVRRRLVKDVLQDEDLPILEWQLLFSIARFGSCHVAHITRHTSIDAAHGSRASAALEKKGLIAREEDPENKRRKIMSLTDKGRDTFERLWPQAKQTNSEFTDRLSRSDIAELKRLLDIMNGVSPPSRETDSASGTENRMTA